MEENIGFVLEILSAGVIVALITGVFSLLVASKNNKRLLKIENNKQKFTLLQEKFKALRDAYDVLIEVLPEEKKLGHVIMNLPAQKDFMDKGMLAAYEIAETNMKILYTHFRKYCYLLSEDEQTQVLKFIERIDTVTKRIIESNVGVEIYGVNDTEEESLENDLRIKATERLLLVTEFEEMYYDLYRNNLSTLSKLNTKK